MPEPHIEPQYIVEAGNRHNELSTRTEEDVDKTKRQKAGRAQCTLEVSNRKSRGRERQVSNRRSYFHIYQYQTNHTALHSPTCKQIMHITHPHSTSGALVDPPPWVTGGDKSWYYVGDISRVCMMPVDLKKEDAQFRHVII